MYCQYVGLSLLKVLLQDCTGAQRTESLRACVWLRRLRLVIVMSNRKIADHKDDGGDDENHDEQWVYHSQHDERRHDHAK